MDLTAPWAHRWAGRLDEHVIDSEVLTGNPLRDPHRRPLYVYTPPGYDADADRRYPSVYLIQGMTGQLDMWHNRKAFAPTVVEAVDAWFAEARAPAIVVYVDAWTSYGGSQFIDSPGTGRYHTYLCEEVVPFVDARYRTLPEAAHRGIAGKSSGGYGAMVTPMLRPDLFGGLVTHAGDALFEVCYQPEFPQAARALREEYDGSFDAFWADFRSRPGRAKRSDAALVNEWAMAACYSTDPDGTVRLPFDTRTGRLDPEIWGRWLAWDPVRMAPERATALRGLRAVWIDAGRQDEYFLDLGAEAFRQELAAIGVDDDRVRFELFEGTHSGVDWRYPEAIGWLAERLGPVR
ncbi:MAG TPA: alpha/beta hydrolase-fold protein [Candidatus Limnocylindrales bacterium]|nr:alpha/beta hydrolase-fold protein [Candidatus Limnocylindrales bacterium]